MAVAEKYKIGQTTIIIDDERCDTSKENIDRVLKNISRIVTRHWREETYQRELAQKQAI